MSELRVQLGNAVGTPLENAAALLIPAPASTPLMPFVLAAGLFLGLSVVHGTKRVVVSATRRRLGRRSRIVIEGPSMRATCEALSPGAIDPLTVALRAGGVAVSVQMQEST